MPSLPRPALLATALVGITALAGCAHRADLATAPVPAQALPPRPVLPPELAAVAPPPRGADGAYRTINAGVSGDRAVWHVRAALNVAAIGCRTPADAGTIVAYNAMLTRQKAALARANASFRDAARAGGDDPDRAMTRLYNYFAMPAAKPGFCAAAASFAPQAAASAPEAFAALAAAALPALEAPFVAVYERVDAVRLADAEWDARYGTARAARLAGAAAPPVTTAASQTGGALPEGSDAAAGHYDLPRAAAPRHPLANAPRLAYAGLDELMRWQPRHEALALR